MADANETVEATLERANRLFKSGMGGTLGILAEADANLSKRLHGLVKKKGTKDLKFTEAQAMLYRQQIQLTNAYLQERLLGHTHAQAVKAVSVGVKNTTKLLSTLEKRFTGIGRPLQLESQAMQDTIVRGLSSSLLRQHQASLQRYGQALTLDFERVMRVAAVEGLTQHETISRMVLQGELGGINAAKLHGAEPGYFPAPAGYVTRRYWAERIVRTETAYAYNAANAASIATARVTDFPDMQKKILAHFDQRTAPDSIAVHGQIRPVNGLFLDGAGRQYQHPPARPNDREVVIPWRPVWVELPATAPAPPEQQAAAQVAAAPGLAPASKGQNLVQASSRAKVVALVEKLKAEKGLLDQQKTTASAFHAAQKAAAASLLEGTQQMGAVKLVDAQALAKAQALQLAKQTKGGVDPAVLKAKAEAYKADLQAKAAQKIAEAQAARAAALKVAAHKHIMLLAEESGEMLDNPGPDLVKHLKKTAKTNPPLFAEMQKQLGIGGESPHWVSVAMAKKIAPEHDYSTFKKGAKKKAEPAPTKTPLPELEFKDVSGYVDIHDKSTGAKLAYMKPAPSGGFSVTPPSNLPGFPQKIFLTKEEGAPYAIEVSQAIQALKAKSAEEQKAAAAKAAAEQAAAAAVKAAELAKVHAAAAKVYDDLMAKARATKGLRSFDLDSLPTARPPASNSVPLNHATRAPQGSHSRMLELSDAFAEQLTLEETKAISAFSGSAYGGMRHEERSGALSTATEQLGKAMAKTREKPNEEIGVEVWRGVHGIKRADLEKWLTEGKCDHGGTASSSWRRQVALNFGSVSEHDDGTFYGSSSAGHFCVVYRWANKSGRSIETMSRHSSENEFLQPKTTRFQVRAAYHPPGARNVVFLELEEE